MKAAVYYFGSVLIVIAIAFCIASLVMKLDPNTPSVMQKECTEKFGEEWKFRDGDRSPDICVNDKGEAKYL